MVGITAAGTDTTAALITNMVRVLHQYPDQLRLVLDDPTLWDNAIHEGLRRSAIATAPLPPDEHAESEIGGVGSRRGATSALSIAAANGDPARFPDPLRFDVRRANAAEHVALRPRPPLLPRRAARAARGADRARDPLPAAART